MAVILSLLKNKFVIGFLGLILLAGLFYFVAKSAYTSIYDSGKQAGIEYQQTIQEQQQAKARQEFDRLQEAADKERQGLNKQIADLNKSNAALKIELANKNQKTRNEVKGYAKTNSGAMSCFAPADDGLRIINQSFPANIN